jgi:hypothetical protein
MLAGGGCTFVGVLLGFVVGRVTRRSTTSTPYVCGCRHALGYHDTETGRCHAVDTTKVVRDEVACTCRQYVGDRPLPELDPTTVLRRIEEN